MEPPCPVIRRRMGYFALLTAFIGLPQEQSPGFWLMVSQLQPAPQAQAYLPLVLKTIVLPSTITYALPRFTLSIVVLIRSFPHPHLPGFLDMVRHGQPSHPHTYTSSPFLKVVFVSAAAAPMKTSAKTTAHTNTNSLFMFTPFRSELPNPFPCHSRRSYRTSQRDVKYTALSHWTQ
jgi:hypothetical protein